MSTRFVAYLVATAIIAAGALNAAPAHAKRAAKTSSKVNAKALQGVQGKFKFGMSPRAVCKILEERIKEKYAEKISGTTDPFVQDKLRKKMKIEYARIAATFVRFRGTAKGWDVSVIDKEFAYKTSEAMLYWEDQNNRNNRRFFFFFRGKLYKTLTTLDMTKLRDDQREFSIIQRVVEKRFGKGKVVFADNGGIKEAAHIDWYAKGLWVRASDKLRFYNTFIVSAIDRKLWARVVAERAKHPVRKKGNNILKSIVDPSKKGPSLDENGNVIKEITGGNKKK